MASRVSLKTAIEAPGLAITTSPDQCSPDPGPCLCPDPDPCLTPGSSPGLGSCPGSGPDSGPDSNATTSMSPSVIRPWLITSSSAKGSANTGVTGLTDGGEGEEEEEEEEEEDNVCSDGMKMTMGDQGGLSTVSHKDKGSKDKGPDKGSDKDRRSIPSLRILTRDTGNTSLLLWSLVLLALWLSLLLSLPLWLSLLLLL